MSEGIKISQLQEKSDINGSEYLLAQDGGTNKKISTSKFATKSDIPSDYVTTENLTTELEKKLDVNTYNSDKATFATKEEIPSLDDYVTTENLTTELEKKLDVDTYNSDKETFATKDEIPSLDDYVTTEVADEKYQTKGDYITSESISSLPEIEEIKTKISGEGVSAIKVVTEIPGEPEPDVLYIVIPKE